MNEKKFIIFSPDGHGEANDPSATEDSEGSDRRRHTRHRVGVLTEIVTVDREKLPGITFNMSRSGAYLLTLVPLESGEEVELCFISDTGQREVMRGRVVHAAELKKEMFWSQGIGIEFVEGAPGFFKVEFEE